MLSFDQAKSGFTCGYVNDTVNNKEGIVVAGGLDSTDVAMKDTYFFNLRTEEWKKLGYLDFDTSLAGQLVVMRASDTSSVPRRVEGGEVNPSGPRRRRGGGRLTPQSRGCRER